MSDLVIKDVPDDKAVITEILANAETSIRNFYDKQIRVVAPEKEVEFETAVASFKLANKQAIKEESDGLGQVEFIGIGVDGIPAGGVIGPDTEKHSNP
jgi:hypothetical protein